MSEFRLSESQRSELRPGINHAALENLLARLPPEDRDWFLEYFRVNSTVGHAGIVAAANPELDRLLKEVWATPGRPEAPVAPGSVTREPVTVALAPQIGDPTAGAIAIRRTGGQSDIVILPRHRSSAAQLHLALRALAHDRMKSDLPEGSFRRIYVRAAPELGDSEAHVRLREEVERTLGQYIAKLPDAPPAQIPGFGELPAIQITPWRPEEGHGRQP